MPKQKRKDKKIKKITLVVKSVLSDKTLKDTLVLLGIKKGAVHTTRDASGNIVLMVIHLKTVSNEQLAALKLIAGITDVEVVDIPDGFDGWDATAESLDTLIMDGFIRTEYLNPPVLTFNSDGSCTYGASDTYASTFWEGIGQCASYPLELEAEMKIKFSDGPQNSMIVLANDVYSCNLQLQGTLGIGEPEIGEFSTEYTPGTDYHTYKLTIDSTGLATAYMDGVSKITHQLTARDPGNYVRFGLSMTAGRTQTIDYMRWTLRP